jgi:hypothetical protein
VAELFLAQLTDPFRIVLAIGLVLTMLRTRAASGAWIPLAAGVVFIAVLIPMTMGADAADRMQAIIAGIFSTSIIVAVVLGLRALVLRARGR